MAIRPFIDLDKPSADTRILPDGTLSLSKEEKTLRIHDGVTAGGVVFQDKNGVPFFPIMTTMEMNAAIANQTLQEGQPVVISDYSNPVTGALGGFGIVKDIYSGVAEVLCNVEELLQHIAGDATKWKEYYAFQKECYLLAAGSRGLKPDNDNPETFTDTYTVTSEFGGLLEIRGMNTGGNYISVSIGGSVVWTSSGIAWQVIFNKSFMLKAGDVITVTNSITNTFTPFIADPTSALATVYASCLTQIQGLQQQVLNLEASVKNKVLDTANKVDIEAQSTGAGFTVDNALGGVISGQGGNYLLVGTGTVDVAEGGITTRVYNNEGVPLGIGNAPTMSVVVDNGSVITSAGMVDIFFTPYIAA